jgi:peptide/nickel transport system substrate-binding protein
VTAEDIKFSWDRATNPEKRLGILSRLMTIREVQVVDPTTVRILTREPDGLLLKRAAYVPIFPKAYLERVGDAEFGIRPIGSGPFKLKEWVPNDRLVLTGIPEHPTRPALRELTIRQVNEAATRVAGLRTGELDLISQAPLDQVDSLKSQGFETVVINAGISNGFFMDPIISNAPTRDKRVRQAINYAIDKEAIAKNIYRGYVRVDQGQVVQEETFGFNPNLKAYPYDPAKAKQLLAEAGYPTGFKVSMEVYNTAPEWPSVGLFVQQQLRDIGIEADLQVTTDAAAWLDHFYGRTPRPHLLSVGLQATPAMDADYALVWFSGTQPLPLRHYDNQEFDRYYLPSRTEIDEAKRRLLLQQAIAVMHEDPPFLFLTSATQVWVFKKTVSGVTRRTDQEPKFENVRRTG